ncbi:MAG: phosphoglucosamine mutase, partial [Acetobacteraceae bacterium]
DGIVAGLAVMNEIITRGKTLAELCAPLVKYPQVLLNVELNGRGHDEVMRDAALGQTVAGIEARLAGQGRVLLRPSGTQALIRVMVEGPELGLIEACANELGIAVETAARR